MGGINGIKARQVFGKVKLGKLKRNLPNESSIDPLYLMRAETEAMAMDRPRLIAALQEKIAAGQINGLSADSVSLAFRSLMLKDLAQRNLQKAEAVAAVRVLEMALAHESDMEKGVLEAVEEANR